MRRAAVMYILYYHLVILCALCFFEPRCTNRRRVTITVSLLRARYIYVICYNSCNSFENVFHRVFFAVAIARLAMCSVPDGHLYNSYYDYIK